MSPHQPHSTSTAEEIEDGDVASDHNTTRLAVLENTCMVEVTVQSAQDFGAPNHGGMNDRVVVRIRWNDARRRSRKNNLRYFSCPDVAEVFRHLVISQLCCGSNAVVFENALKLFGRNGDRSKTCSGDLTMRSRSSRAGPLAFAFARTRIFVSRTILMHAGAAQRGGFHRSPHRFLLPEDR